MQQTNNSTETSQILVRRGIKRLPFSALTIILLLAFTLYPESFLQENEDAFYIFAYALVLVFFVASSLRLKNTGTSQWLSLLLFLPIINLFIVYRCFSAQEGYENTEKLDVAGKVVAIFLAILGFAAIGGLVFMLIQIETKL